MVRQKIASKGQEETSIQESISNSRTRSSEDDQSTSNFWDLVCILLEVSKHKERAAWVYNNDNTFGTRKADQPIFIWYLQLFKIDAIKNTVRRTSGWLFRFIGKPGRNSYVNYSETSFSNDSKRVLAISRTNELLFGKRLNKLSISTSFCWSFWLQTASSTLC